MRRLYLPAVTASATLEVILIFFNNYWTLKRLHSDEGANFTSRLTKELCNLYNKRNSRRTPYHPIGNIRGDMLGTLEPNKKTLKKRYVNPIVRACNSTRQESTGYTPFLLMFVGESRLPINLAFWIHFHSRKQPFSKCAESLIE